MIVRHHQNNFLTLAPISATPAFTGLEVSLTQGKNGCQEVISEQTILIDILDDYSYFNRINGSLGIQT